MNKIVSILLVAVLAASMLVFPVSAASEPTFMLSSSTGRVGDCVEVNVILSNNPGITSFQLKCNYSSDLELISIEDADLFSDSITHSPLSKNPAIISWFSSDSENSDKNGVAAVLTFRVKDNAKNSTVSIEYDKDNVINNAFKNISFATKSNSITIAQELILGDADASEDVSVVDATSILRRCANIAVLSFSPASADADKNGEVDLVDASYIQRWLIDLEPNSSIGKPL